MTTTKTLLRTAIGATLSALLGVATPAAVAQAAPAHTTQVPPLQPLPSLAVTPYMGTWYQVLWVPNRFQAQCVSDTTATYREQGDGTVEVINRCRLADGKTDSATGLARPPQGGARIDNGQLQPARLEVSFLPAWLRWTGLGWGAYWVVDLAPDGRYAIVSEPTRQYLWVLSRQPRLSPADDAVVRERLQALGFNLAQVQAHAHTVVSGGVPMHTGAASAPR